MATPFPPLAGAGAAPDLNTPPDTGGETTQPCPLCSGAGTVPADMSRDDMIEAIDQATGAENPPHEEATETPEQEAAESPAPKSPLPHPHQRPLSEGQQKEVDRLGQRARKRMSGPSSYGM